MNAIAPDGTLYMPETIPAIPRAFFNNIAEMSLQEIAYVVVSALLGSDTRHQVIKNVVDKAFTFPLPIVTLNDGTEVMELFHGPTMAYKDISTRFLAEYVENEHKPTSRPFVGVVATTGNTGVAIADAFSSHPDKKIVVMFPRGFLNRMRRNAVAYAGSNVYPLEVEGTISQCKKLIADAMADHSIAERMMLVCANTKNILRIVPQVAIFFHAYSRLKALGKKADGMTVAIPSACLSNVVAAVVAKRLGLPIGKIVAATNINDDFARFVNGELPLERIHSASRPTLAKAMDAGYPTNIMRLMALYDNNLEALRQEIVPVAVSDEEIVETVNVILSQKNYLVDPHTAVAMHALETLPHEDDEPARLVLATAHPSKSLDVMTEITGKAMELPLQMTRFMGSASGHSNQPRTITRIAPTYPAFRKFLMGL